MNKGFFVMGTSFLTFYYLRAGVTQQHILRPDYHWNIIHESIFFPFSNIGCKYQQSSCTRNASYKSWYLEKWRKTCTSKGKKSDTKYFMQLFYKTLMIVILILKIRSNKNKIAFAFISILTDSHKRHVLCGAISFHKIMFQSAYHHERMIRKPSFPQILLW